LSNNSKNISFGFKPGESEHHFLVYIPSGKGDIVIFEQFHFDEDLAWDSLRNQITGTGSTAKIVLNRTKWDLIADDLRAEFNKRLRLQKLKPSKWASGHNNIHRLFGKELMILAWAVEEADPGTIPLAIQNWLGLRPEERWWLFTTTNAATGHAINGRGRGWRKALRYALGENPVPNVPIHHGALYQSNETPKLFEDPEQEFFGSDLTLETVDYTVDTSGKSSKKRVK
jgi:hypothetical protein